MPRTRCRARFEFIILLNSIVIIDVVKFGDYVINLAFNLTQLILITVVFSLRWNVLARSSSNVNLIFDAPIFFFSKNFLVYIVLTISGLHSRFEIHPRCIRLVK